jgi:hypothetical protein
MSLSNPRLLKGYRWRIRGITPGHRLHIAFPNAQNPALPLNGRANRSERECVSPWDSAWAVDFDAIYPFLAHALTGSQAEPGNPILEALPPVQKATQKLHELLSLKTHKVNSLDSDGTKAGYPAGMPTANVTISPRLQARRRSFGQVRGLSPHSPMASLKKSGI